MAIVTVGITATLLAAADENRGSLTVQHVDADNSAIAVWVGGSNVTVGNGWLLLEFGSTIQIDQMEAWSAWYAIAEVAVDVMTIMASPMTATAYYGTVSGVSAMIPTAGTLGAASIPTSAQVITWLQAASAEIDRAIAQAGYIAPVSDSATAYPMFADLANLWAAARALQALGMDNTSGLTETRSQAMMAEFWERLKAISGLDLSGLGLVVSTTGTAQAVRRIRSIQISRVDKQHLTGGGSEYMEYWPAIHGLD